MFDAIKDSSESLQAFMEMGHKASAALYSLCSNVKVGKWSLNNLATMKVKLTCSKAQVYIKIVNCTILLLRQLFKPLLGRTRSRGGC